jgi:hypothetical protein
MNIVVVVYQMRESSRSLNGAVSVLVKHFKEIAFTWQ